jgi:acetyltransferase-like isoleucine patch superfamily enzyme
VNSFYSQEELEKLGFKALGSHVSISRKTSIYAPELISVGDDVRIDDYVFLSGEITLGKHIHIAPFCALIGGTGGAGVVMEDYSGLSGHVIVYSISDDYSGEFMTNPTIPAEYTNVQKGRVIIHKYAIVGASTVVLPGIVIGEGTAVGAMSLVARSLPGWKICSGAPARPLRDRSNKLLELERKFASSAL